MKKRDVMILRNNFTPAEYDMMSKEIYVLRDDRGIFVPYREYAPWESTMLLRFAEHTMNYALWFAVRKVLTQTSGGLEHGDMVFFFNRAYAIAIHILNHRYYSVYQLRTYLKIWDDPIDTSVLTEHYMYAFSHLDTELCKNICASMVYCILDHEDSPRPNDKLEEIEWLLQTSQNGRDTLKVFREAVASICATQEGANNEQQPKADPPQQDKEEETAPTLATKDVFFKNTALLQFKAAGGMEMWAGLVNEAIQDIVDHTLSSSLNNTMLAVMYYFASGWHKRKGIFKREPDVKQLVYFFLSRCAFQPTCAPKTLVNKLNELLKGDKKIKETDETEQVRKNIQKIIEKNS